jgi:Family of unknown function (DUF6492)
VGANDPAQTSSDKGLPALSVRLGRSVEELTAIRAALPHGYGIARDLRQAGPRPAALPIDRRRGGMSFALTIALADTGRPHSDLTRLRTLLASFVKYFDMSALADFIVITRPDDLAPLKTELSAFTSKIPSLRVLNERDLCPELASIIHRAA